MQAICEQMYSLIYAEDIKNQLMKAIGKKRKKSGLEDVYALKKRLQVEIIFPISPFLTHTDLYVHYQRGVISWDTYTKHACDNVSLPHEQMEEPTKKTEDSDENRQENREETIEEVEI